MDFEKMGLPPRPFDKGKDWTPDSSNCEGCQANFTLCNRKHHCRRCGGLFCNNCTPDRLYLRGQGDAPARVCTPCKQIEDAAKIEKYGKSKTLGGGYKASISKDDGTDALLKQLFEKPHDEKVHVESIVASVADHDRDNDHEHLSPSQALGWSDKEIRDGDEQPAAKSEEQLQAELAAEVRSKSDRAAATRAVVPGPNDAMSWQILAHKRQALAHKREGRLAEARDELRKAKILEKQVHEMALLGQAEGEEDNRGPGLWGPMKWPPGSNAPE